MGSPGEHAEVVRADAVLLSLPPDAPMSESEWQRLKELGRGASGGAAPTTRDDRTGGLAEPGVESDSSAPAGLAEVVRAGAAFYMRHRLREYQHPNDPSITMGEHKPNDPDCKGCRAEAALAALVTVAEDATRQAGSAARGYEQLRAIIHARPSDTKKRDTYGDGYTSGLIEAMHLLNRAALSGGTAEGSTEIGWAARELDRVAKNVDNLPDYVRRTAEGSGEETTA